MHKFKDLGVKLSSSFFTGDKVKIDRILNRKIIVHAHKIEVSKFPKNKSGNVLTLQIEINNEKQIIFTGSDVLMDQITQVNKEHFPFETEIIKVGEHFEFN